MALFPIRIPIVDNTLDRTPLRIAAEISGVPTSNLILGGIIGFLIARQLGTDPLNYIALGIASPVGLKYALSITNIDVNNASGLTNIDQVVTENPTVSIDI